jgi:hypothetical protein
MCIPDVLRIAGCLPAASTTGEKETTARLDCAGLVFTAQESGVAVRPAVFYFRHRVDDNPAQLAKMRQVAGQVPGFVRDPALISQHGVSPGRRGDRRLFLPGPDDRHGPLPGLVAGPGLTWMSGGPAGGGSGARRRMSGTRTIFPDPPPA